MEQLGIAPLIDDNQLPDLKTIAGNVIKNKAIDYAAGKIGLNAAQASGLMSILGMGASTFAPLAAVSALSGRSLGISDYLANKRANKAIQKNIANDTQGEINTAPINILNTQPTNQDTNRTNITTTTKTTAAPSRQARHTSGIGGLHNYG